MVVGLEPEVVVAVLDVVVGLGAAVVVVSLEFNLLRRPPSVVVVALDVLVGLEP